MAARFRRGAAAQPQGTLDLLKLHPRDGTRIILLIAVAHAVFDEYDHEQSWSLRFAVGVAKAPLSLEVTLLAIKMDETEVKTRFEGR